MNKSVILLLQVFYRKGIDGVQAYTNENSACGCNWIDMVGDFKLISVGPNDQVCINSLFLVSLFYELICSENVVKT